ncbi:hypothetical protein HGRIS_013998 [Hohenbuehelia grisea]|uniref:Uncharacterized protein n=1 Tax=Hohenbuehelia grisea TaxID=104357 RepID=A0ABR3JSA7_9AGAR
MGVSTIREYEEERVVKRKQRDAHSQELREWERQEKARKTRNRARDVELHAAVEAWKRDVHNAKLDGRRPGSKRPKKADFDYESPIRRPRAQPIAEGDTHGEEEEGDGSDEQGDDDDDGGMYISD